MGMKSAPQMPPPIEPEVIDKTAEAEAKVAAEKEKMLGMKKKRSIWNYFNFWYRR